MQKQTRALTTCRLSNTATDAKSEVESPAEALFRSQRSSSSLSAQKLEGSRQSDSGSPIELASSVILAFRFLRVSPAHRPCDHTLWGRRFQLRWLTCGSTTAPTALAATTLAALAATYRRSRWTCAGGATANRTVSVDPFCDGLPVESAKTLAADGQSLFGKRLRPELDLECPGRQDPEPAKRRMGIMLKILSNIRTEPWETFWRVSGPRTLQIRCLDPENQGFRPGRLKFPCSRCRGNATNQTNFSGLRFSTRKTKDSDPAVPW